MSNNADRPAWEQDASREGVLEKNAIHYACPLCNSKVTFRADFPAEPPAAFSGFCFECGDWVDFEKVAEGENDDQAKED